MKNLQRTLIMAAALLLILGISPQGIAQVTKEKVIKKEITKKVNPNKKGMVVLKLKLPKPVFAGTPKNAPPGTNVEKRKGPRKPFMVPKGCVNVAKGKKVTSSDMEPLIGEMKQITDGDKETIDGSFVELGPDKQWVQIDLCKKYKVYAILVWHYHKDPRVFKGVVVQSADEPEFIMGVKTLFNNDTTNSQGLGIGKAKQYFENFEGRLVDAKGAKTRYLRFYSNGSTADDLNQYIEIEVYGKE
jgi:hypothetical protein